MIHDKDYIIRIVQQFSEFLNRMILEKNEGELPEHQRTFDTQMKDVFKMSFEELEQLSSDEIVLLVAERETKHQILYFELLGHLFYLKRATKDTENLKKSMFFYGLYLGKSGIFSLPIINRISELKNISHGITNG